MHGKQQKRESNRSRVPEWGLGGEGVPRCLVGVCNERQSSIGMARVVLKGGGSLMKLKLFVLIFTQDLHCGQQIALVLPPPPPPSLSQRERERERGDADSQTLCCVVERQSRSRGHACPSLIKGDVKTIKLGCRNGSLCGVAFPRYLHPTVAPVVAAVCVGWHSPQSRRDWDGGGRY